jgi:hypothetical protein
MQTPSAWLYAEGVTLDVVSADPTGLGSVRREMQEFALRSASLPKNSVFQAQHVHWAQREVAMVLPGIVDAWNGWTDFTDPQDFMDRSRARGHATIGAAVDAYVIEITGMRRE